MTLHPRPLAPALAAAEEAGWATVRVDLGGVRGKAELMRRWEEALELPHWFGRNWDALADALGDLSWLPETPGRLIAVTSWRGWAAARPGDWETLREVLEEAVARGREAVGGPQLDVVLDDGPAEPPEGAHGARS
ncbi:barstar family protein [Streptomyces toxytricini]|uniref:Barstar family protein n=1 Tax=Streptomyces toxytricini TaxID=67369 RepID=A0ABW8ER21_STRT5